MGLHGTWQAMCDGVARFNVGGGRHIQCGWCVGRLHVTGVLHWTWGATYRDAVDVQGIVLDIEGA